MTYKIIHQTVYDHATTFVILQINDVLGNLNYVHFYPLMEMTSSYARDIIAPQSSKRENDAYAKMMIHTLH